MNTKRLTIAIPEVLISKFKNACDQNYKTMSEALRDYIKEYIKKTEESCQVQGNTKIQPVKHTEIG